MIEIDTRDVDELLAALAEGAVDDEIAAVAADVIPEIGRAELRAIRGAAARHRRTGKLDAALELEVAGQGAATTAEIHAGGVAAIIVGGSRAHDIRPAAGHALRLVGGSVTGFAAGVHHPGTAPDPFVARGVAAADGERSAIIDAGAARLAGRVASRLEEG